jgi:hypothetical protein
MLDLILLSVEQVDKECKAIGTLYFSKDTEQPPEKPIYDCPETKKARKAYFAYLKDLAGSVAPSWADCGVDLISRDPLMLRVGIGKHRTFRNARKAYDYLNKVGWILRKHYKIILANGKTLHNPFSRFRTAYINHIDKLHKKAEAYDKLTARLRKRAEAKKAKQKRVAELYKATSFGEGDIHD